MFPSHTETLQCRNDLLLQMRRVQAKFQGSESAGHQGELPRERGHPAKGREAMNEWYDLDLPTLQQIGEKADALEGIPMSDEESQEWFEQTCATNARRRANRIIEGA